MRNAFIKALCELAVEDDRHYLLTADLGFGVIEPFAKQFPERFINVGAAEQNMIGIATGLAASGKIPWCYSISTFATMRGLEQIRHAAMHDFDIRIVGVGGGFAYGPAGFTHWGLEDVALMRSLHHMTVWTPEDPEAVKDCLVSSKEGKGPLYLRLGKGGEEEVCYEEFSKSDSIILGMGTMAPIALDVARKLGVNYRAIRSLKPLIHDGHDLLSYNKIVTIEEHFLTGGLFSAVVEAIAQSTYTVLPQKVMPFAVRDFIVGHVGSREWCLKENGLTVDQIVEKLKGTL